MQLESGVKTIICLHTQLTINSMYLPTLSRKITICDGVFQHILIAQMEEYPHTIGETCGFKFL
jgi:hypothetical protein